MRYLKLCAVLALVGLTGCTKATALIDEMTGTTLHTVSRLMSGWENDGLVKSGRQKITVIGSEGLTLIANKEGPPS